MISGLDRKNNRRLWQVRNYSVYGSISDPSIAYLAVENVAGTNTVYYGERSLMGTKQIVLFSSLTDSFGNSLPPSIKSPLVIIQPRGEHSAFVVGDISDSSFSIARGELSPKVINVDLIIVEMGR